MDLITLIVPLIILFVLVKIAQLGVDALKLEPPIPQILYIVIGAAALLYALRLIGVYH